MYKNVKSLQLGELPLPLYTQVWVQNARHTKN